MKIIVLVVFFITLLGAGLRLVNISPLKIYPDAYQNLLVARNIREYHSVVAPLGEGGHIFPPFFAWSRPGFSLLINLFSFLNLSEEIVALYLSIFLGIISIPLSFLVVKRLLSSNTAGIFASLLLTLSFDHIVWGGFILTETTGVFFLLLYLLSLSFLRNKAELLSLKDIFSGVLFAVSILVRYEYVVLLFPAVYYIYKTTDKFYFRIVNLLVGMTLVFISVFIQLFPLDSFLIIRNQVAEDLARFFILIGIMVGFVLFQRLVPDKIKSFFSKMLVRILFVTSAVVIILTLIVKFTEVNILNFQYYSFGAGNFMTYDFLLFISFIFGLVVMYIENNHKAVIMYSVLSFLSLLPFYFFVNPGIQRYWTHVIPFMLIPAAYGLNYLYSRIDRRYFVLLIPFLLLQTYLSFSGVKNWRNGEWFSTSYEEEAANILNDKFNQDKHLLIVSLPEAYYFFTNTPVQSVADEEPYLFVDTVPETTPVYVVIDMGMRRYFPNFTHAIEQSLTDKIAGTYWVNRTFHVGPTSYQEQYPVTVYETDLANLKSKINMLD